MQIHRFDLKDQQMTVQASTVLKVLGRSSLFILDILIREAIQNSLDAIHENSKSVEFYLDIIRSPNHEELINKISFLQQREVNDLLYKRLVDRILENDPVLLILSDKGTTGLSGPVRRDDFEWNTYKGRKNFENLVYQLGLNHGSSGAGGSYGFGKSIFYQLSSVGLVMFYSKSKEGERLVFNMISKDENRISTQSTGIAWWGDVYNFKGDKFSAPILDSVHISEILKKMNLQHKQFGPKETGTLICIISPKLKNLLDNEGDIQEEGGKLEFRTTDQIIKNLERLITESVLRWYWPRMTETKEVSSKGSLKPLKFFIGSNELKLPAQYQAMGRLLIAAEDSNNKLIQNDNSIQTKKIYHSYGHAFLGTLSFNILSINSKLPHLNKILMIRKPRMVVFEMPISERFDKSVAALFLVNSNEKVWPNNKRIKLQDLDDAFRDCESATHSEWNYQDLNEEKSWFKSYVKSSKEKIVKIIQDEMNPQEKNEIDSLPSSSAKMLGQLLFAEGGGSIQGFKTKVNNSSGTSNRNLQKFKIEIFDKEFPEDGTMNAIVHVKYIEKGAYELVLLARGGRESYDSILWKENLGKEFPFKILGCTNDQNIKIKISKHAGISFKVDSKFVEELKFQINIEMIKRDTLLSFNIKKIE